MIYFVGAGPGAVDLITVRGQKLIECADLIIYAGSLVNPQILDSRKTECEIYDSSTMTLEEVIQTMDGAIKAGKEKIVRLHTGDPSIYGAIQEQMELLDQLGLAYEVVPGVSSFLGAAAALKREYTLPGVSQTVILTRLEGRTNVPDQESIKNLATHQATMAIFLSTGLLPELVKQLVAGGYQENCPAAIVYKATWPDQKVVYTTIENLAEAAKENQITKTALILVGRFLENNYERSKLYDPSFSHEFRQAST